MSIKLFKGARPVTKQFAKSVRFAIGTVSEHLIYNKFVKTATKYLHPKFVVKATAARKFDLRDAQFCFMVTVGRPNYAATKFIKQCAKAKQNIPLNRAQLKHYPKKRKK